jgi:dihydroxy-acid dehydratase
MTGAIKKGDGPKLRSHFEMGTTRWAVRRAQWIAMGIKEEDFDKPKVAVVNSSSHLSVCYRHLDGIAAKACEYLRDAGMLPFEIRTVAPSDFVTSAGKQGRYLMPSRDLLVNDIEVQVEGAVLDAMLLLSSCDKTTPAHLMAAARLDIPSLIVPCGYQLGGDCGGRSVDIEDVYKAVGTVKAGRMTVEDLTAWTCKAIEGPGVCAGLGTANSMHIMAEALGMTVAGAAPVRAGSEALEDNLRRSALSLVDAINNERKPRDILNAGAFRNAVRIASSVGVSVNCVRHLTATAKEARLDVEVLDLFRTFGETAPLLVNVRPNGPFRIEDFDAAGGALAVIQALGEEMEDTLTITGETMRERQSGPKRSLKSVASPASPLDGQQPGLCILKGSLAPIGAVVKLAAVPRDAYKMRGPARVYEDEDDAIMALAGDTISSGDVIVLRMLGPIGGPGTVFAASFMAALVGAGLGETVAVVTDGELSGLNKGITIGQVMPEAAEGGPLALVRDGDMIDIDISQRTIDLVLTSSELAERRKRWSPPKPTEERGWLYQYSKLVQPLAQGAVLCRLDPPSTGTEDN